MALPDEATLRVILAASFAAAALLAFAAARRSNARDRRAWLLIGAVLVLLGGAKLIGLQEGLTGTLRDAALARGWYGFHREAQAAFGLIVGLLAVVGAVVMTRRLRHRPAPLVAAAVGLALLLVSLVVRTASFHAVDLWTTAQFAGMRRGWWLEAICAAVIAACGVAYRSSESS